VTVALVRSAPEHKPLWPHQNEAVEAIFRAWDADRSTLLVMATGTGKTRTFVQVIKQRRDADAYRRVLVLAHRVELLDQAMATMREFGMSVELEQGENRAHRGLALSKSAVVVGSVMSMKGPRLKAWPSNEFDLVIVDESHRAIADTYRGILDHFAGAKVLGVTATPDRADKVGLRAVFDSTAYEYEILQAISDGILCPVRQVSVMCDEIDLSDVRVTAGKLSDADIEQAMTADAVLHQIAEPLARVAGARQTIVFVTTVKQAHDFAAILGVHVGPELVTVVDGKMSKDARREALDGYRDLAYQFIVNVGVLTEGYDNPATSCIAMVHPTLSRARYAQCIGRGTRIAPGKADCLVVDFAGNSGRHTLVRVEDALLGADAPDHHREAVAKAVGDGEDINDAIEKADARKKERDERMRKRRERVRVFVKNNYTPRDVNPFTGAGSLDDMPAMPGTGGREVTDKMAHCLERAGWPTDMDFKTAAFVIGWNKKWQHKPSKLEYLKQRALDRYGSVMEPKEPTDETE